MRITTLARNKTTWMGWWAKLTIRLPWGSNLLHLSLLWKKRILMSSSSCNQSSRLTCRNLRLEEPATSLSFLTYTSNWIMIISRKLIRHSRINNNKIEETKMAMAQSTIRKPSSRMATRVSDSQASPKPSRFRTLSSKRSFHSFSSKLCNRIGYMYRISLV